MAFLPILGAVASLAGTAVSAMGTIAGSKSQANSLNYQAAVERQKAAQEVASGQRKALEDTRKAGLVQSSIQAKSATSGFGADDPNIVDLSSGVAGRGAYMAGLNMFQGRNQAWNYEVDARGKDMMAGAYRTSGNASALGTILGGAGGFFKTASQNDGAGFKFSSGTGPLGTNPDDEEKKYPYPNFGGYS